MSRLAPLLFALALIGCDEGISDDTDSDTLDVDTTDTDTDTTEPDTEDPDTTEPDTDTDTRDPACVGGGRDDLECNDTATDATVLTLPFAHDALNIHDEEDDDYFVLDITEQIGVEVRIELNNSNGDLDMRLADSDDNTVATGFTTQDVEQFTPVLEPGSYTLRVYGYAGATGDYTLTMNPFAVEEIDVDEVFSDLTVTELVTPEVFATGRNQYLGLASHIYNIGTAPAPGSDLGDGTGEFRLRQLDGTVVASGIKGPIYFTNNGGCPGDAIKTEWLRRGQPHIPGTRNNPSLTSPGCADYYSPITNANLDTPIVIGNPATVPDGAYIYELEVDAAGTYVWEAPYVRANNSGWVPITIGTTASGRRTVTVTGPLRQSGQIEVDAGTIGTVLGSGDALDGTPTSSTSAIGDVWGVARDPSGKLLATLPDAGTLVRVSDSGALEVLASGLTGVRGVDVHDNGDILVVDFAANSILTLPYNAGAGTYGPPASLALTGAALNGPSTARYDSAGNIWVANTNGHQILRIDRLSMTTSVALGTGSPGLGGDGGIGILAKLYRPIDIDITDDGMLVVADGYTNRIRLMNTNAAVTISLCGMAVAPGRVATFAGVGTIAAVGASASDNGTLGYNGDGRHGRATTLDHPTAVHVVDNRLFIVDSDNHRVRMFDEYGTAHDLAGSVQVPRLTPLDPGTSSTVVGDGGAAADARLNTPLSLFVTATEAGYAIDIADRGNHRVRQLDSVLLTPGHQIDDN